MRPEELAHWNQWAAVGEALRVEELQEYWRENAPPGEAFDVKKARALKLRNENRACLFAVMGWPDPETK
jgi:hypothetical protein